MNKKFLFTFLFLPLVGCQSLSDVRSVAELKKLSKKIDKQPHDVVGIYEQAKRTEKTISQETKTVRQLLAILEEVISKRWGKGNEQLPSKKKYVKYSNDYKARAIVDFNLGKVIIETIEQQTPSAMLTKATTATLLSPSDPNKNDIFSSKPFELSGEPFLYPQVADHEGKLVRFQWRADRYANHLVSKGINKKIANGKTIYWLEFNLLDNNQQLRKQKYSQHVLAAAKQYNVPASLIYAVIETESSFNPFAVSSAGAYGLMQVVPSTAGKDVYQKIKNKAGQPTKKVLFDVAQNIDIGSAYLHILKDNYLKAIQQKKSKHYAIISAYNGGAGNVLKTFDIRRDRAMDNINAAQPSQVYSKLRHQHPSLESRKYLEKVTAAEKGYLNN